MENKSCRASVSVVIPFYSNAEWLCEAVDSVLAQDYDNFESVVVNDGSKEDVSGFLERYGDKIKYFEKENGGCASARNRSVAEASGEYLAFLDSDDLWTEGKLSRQMEKMREYGAAWSYTDFEVFGESVATERRVMVPGAKEGMYKTISPYTGTPTVIVKKSLITDNGLTFCEGFRYGQDDIFWERLIDLEPVLYIPEVLARVRMRGNNAARRAAVQIHARVEFYDKCAELIPGFKGKCSWIYRLAVALCRFGRIFVPEKKLNGGFTEFIARVMFAVPYLLFKIDRKLHG